MPLWFQNNWNVLSNCPDSSNCQHRHKSVLSIFPRCPGHFLAQSALSTCRIIETGWTLHDSIWQRNCDLNFWNTLTSKAQRAELQHSPRHSRDQWFHAIHRHWCGCPQFRRAHRFRAPRSLHTARLQNLDIGLLQTQLHHMLQIVPPLDVVTRDMFIFTRTVCKRACLFRGTNKHAAIYSILGRPLGLLPFFEL